MWGKLDLLWQNTNEYVGISLLHEIRMKKGIPIEIPFLLTIDPK